MSVKCIYFRKMYLLYLFVVENMLYIFKYIALHTYFNIQDMHIKVCIYYPIYIWFYILYTFK